LNPLPHFRIQTLTQFTAGEKYQKVKRYFFDQQAQVHQLQNTLANQRLSLSRTSLDDSEYATRFNRLDGLIADLSHSIRKNWVSVPLMLQPAVNKEAVQTGGKEMIVMGRAFISSWLVDEVFDKYFHPDLDMGLSSQLKLIQNNIRRYASAAQNPEEEEALTSKIINWRLATIEGLQDTIRNPQSSSNRQHLVKTLNERLIASMESYLQNPTPTELTGGVPMIVELAVTILMHLPLESRDVLIEYYPPGHGIVSDFMKMETGVTPLTNPCSDGTVVNDGDGASLVSNDSAPRDSISGDQDPSAVPSGASVQQQKEGDQRRGGRGMLAGLINPKQKGPPQQQQGKIATGTGGGSQVSLPQQEEKPPQRVRMAAGVSVRIRGRSVLVKAPVYGT
jgi:hypothetical protein